MEQGAVMLPAIHAVAQADTVGTAGGFDPDIAAGAATSEPFHAR